jgi:hypothetical protein
MSETRVWSPRENLVAICWFLLVGPDSKHAIAEERTAESGHSGGQMMVECFDKMTICDCKRGFVR